jgi:hypothetical protein
MKKIVPNNANLIPPEAKRVFEGEIFSVYQWQQKMFDGSQETFEMLKRSDSVKVIPLLGKRIITIKDNQPYTGAKNSFPGGRVDSSDGTTLDAARRELKEETGYEFDKWKLVSVVQMYSKLECLYIIMSPGKDVRRGSRI